MLAGAYLFHTFESRRIDEQASVSAAIRDNAVHLSLSPTTFSAQPPTQAMGLTVLYTYGDGDHIASVLSSEAKPVLVIAPSSTEAAHRLVIKRAQYGPIASTGTGWLVALCLACYISFYSVGPGVVVWLTLAELMPTRIRSTGMGIALLLNQGASTLIAAIFLPTVGNHGFSPMFLFWATATTVYFLIATFLLPETKGKTLEEIERHFEGGAARRSLA